MIEFLNTHIWASILLAAIVFGASLLLRKWFTNYFFKLILSYTKKKKIHAASTFLVAFEKPVRWVFVVIGIQLAFLFLPIQTVSFESSLVRSCFIGLLTWGLFNLSSVTTLLFPKLMTKLDINVDKIIVPFITKMLKTLVLMLGFSIIAQEWGFNINGFIAGLGLGGLAIALAAKETVSNLFGGVVLVTEKPFTIGDWIKTPSVEGTIEDITFRSTKVRTFAQALVTVPNSTLANEPIINWSKMGKRQVSFYLKVDIHTKKERLQATIANMKAVLERHPGVHPETILVSLESLNDSSADILIYFFTKATDYNGYLQTKEDINFQIIEIIEKKDVAFAVPKSTVHVEMPAELNTADRLFSHG
ncbi:mechanosensitive ion channel family protein [Niallia sp. BSM11]|uniref:mechanosensitive ion channel family protein n=1 Tax=Niallia sp. BSM11 TaxID=3391576 RepID=UPI003984FEE4